MGTAAAAVPIRSITRLSTSDKLTFWGTAGADGVESRLLGLARIMGEIQRGQREDTEGWCWEVVGEEGPVEGSRQDTEKKTDERVVAVLSGGRAMSTVGRMLASMYPATLLGLWAFFVAPVPVAGVLSSLS